MPELKELRELKLVDLEQEPFKLFGDPVEDAYALQLVKQSFERSSTWRQGNHDRRWLKDDQLYRGDVPVRYWKGTETPRSSLGIPVAFDQVESAYPNVIGELFSQHPFWFGVEASQYSTPQDARATQSVLGYQLTCSWDRTGQSAEHQLKTAIRQALQHGNGVAEVGWHSQQQRLFVEWVDLRDFYFDPSISTSLIDHAAYAIRRKLISVEAVESLRGYPGFKIPDKSSLNTLAKSLPLDTAGDTTKNNSASINREDRQGISQLIPDPAQQQIELLQFWSDDRVIWVLNRKVVIYNQKNPYGFKPFVMCPLYIVLGRPYAMSIPDVIEGEQNFIQGVINARADELSLALHPPRYISSDAAHRLTKPWEPGMTQQVHDVGKEVLIHVPSNITQSAFEEVSLAQQRVNTRTGIGPLTQGEVPTPSNANRSATGINRQVGAANTRLRPIVENIEDYLIVPLLYKAHEILQLFGGQQLQGVGGQRFDKNSVARPVQFKMVASSKMVTRERLLQLMGPITQTLLNDAVMGALQKTGQTVDLQEWSRFFQDATGLTETYTFFRQMTPEEQQMQQQPPAEALMEMQMKQQELETRVKMGELKAQSELQVAQIESITKADSQAEQSALGILKIIAEQMNQRTDISSKEKIAVLKAAVDRIKAATAKKSSSK